MHHHNSPLAHSLLSLSPSLSLPSPVSMAPAVKSVIQQHLQQQQQLQLEILRKRQYRVGLNVFNKGPPEVLSPSPFDFAVTSLSCAPLSLATPSSLSTVFPLQPFCNALPVSLPASVRPVQLCCESRSERERERGRPVTVRVTESLCHVCGAGEREWGCEGKAKGIQNPCWCVGVARPGTEAVRHPPMHRRTGMCDQRTAAAVAAIQGKNENRLLAVCHLIPISSAADQQKQDSHTRSHAG